MGATLLIVVMGGLGGLLLGRLVRRLSVGTPADFAAGLAGGGLSQQLWAIFVPRAESGVGVAAVGTTLAQLPDLLVAALGGAAIVALLGVLRNLMAR